MNRKRLTKTLVESIPVPSSGEAVLWDSEVRGFHVRIRPSGRRTYFFFYRSQAGEQRKPRIGEHGPAMTADQARGIAIEYRAAVERGEDPEEFRRSLRGGETLEEYWERYLAYARPRWKPKTLEESLRRWRLHLAPALGRKPLPSITRRDVQRFHESLAESPVMANRCVSLLRAVYNRALDAGDFAGENPAARVKCFAEHSRETYLSLEQVRQLFEAIAVEEALGGDGQRPVARVGKSTGRGGRGLRETRSRGVTGPAAALFRLLLLTGARLSDIRTAQWSFVDWEGAALRLPDSKTGKKVVWLSEPALDELRSLHSRRTQEKWVIEGEVKGTCLTPPQKAWRRVRRRAANETGDAIFHILRIHDLRHSLASLAINSGVPLAHVGKILGHASARTTERYAHVADDPTRQAVAAVGEQIRKAIVVDITKNSGTA